MKPIKRYEVSAAYREKFAYNITPGEFFPVGEFSGTSAADAIKKARAKMRDVDGTLDRFTGPVNFRAKVVPEHYPVRFTRSKICWTR